MIPQFGTIPLIDEPVPAYFAMLMMAFVVAITSLARWGKREGLDHNGLIDLGLYCLIWGVLGARFLHVFVDGYFMDYVHLCTDPSLVDWQITRAQCSNVEGIWDAAAGVCHPSQGDCFAWAKFWQGGLVWYGGLLGAGAFGIHFIRKEKFPVLKVMDVAGIAILLGIFCGRLGCWFGGCCFGQPSEHWSAVRFPAWSAASESQFRSGLLSSPALESLPVLPMQLWESGGVLLLAALAILWLQPRKSFDGQVFCFAMAGYALVRIFLEMFRADERGEWLGVTTSQWIGGGIIAAMLVFALRLAARKRSVLEAMAIGSDSQQDSA